ncbi:MAG: YaeQ family protein [Betaproteobacteria bacterium]|nr:YaeQ family protein [Betaproteobacteria bacterium]
MALKSTIFKADLQVADLDRGHFADYALTLARHPSETDERMMVRLLAFALHAGPDLGFGKGLSSDDEPALQEIDPGGVVRRLIEVGIPDESRVRKACGRADAVVVLAYGGRSVDVWWERNAGAFARLDKLTVLRLTAEEGSALAALAERGMKLACTIQEGVVYLEGIELKPQRLQ